MLLKTATSLAFATACLTAIATLPAHAQMVAPGAAGTEVVTNGPQTNPRRYVTVLVCAAECERKPTLRPAARNQSWLP